LEILSINGFKVQSLKKNPGLLIKIFFNFDQYKNFLINLDTGKFEPVEASTRCEIIKTLL
jgi:hypothetical protein